ncbi:MAG: hypothetical protein IJU26_02515 [Synergistaceae bacterium]|nr:hypothetical protein [Synergistaceae bacterium]
MKISDNPFFTLGVSTRADRKQIASAADAKAFVQDSEAVRAARTSLVIPSKRLYAEVRWFPGTEDANVREIVSFFRRFSVGQTNPGINASIFRGLTLLNFAVYMFSYRKFRDKADMSQSILAICRCFDAINTGGLCAVINNDRTIAGFPPISEQELAHELNDYRRDILRNIDGRMSVLLLEKYTELLEELADSYADDDGDYHGSLMLDDIMAGYELRILPQLEEQIRMILDSVTSIGDYVPEKVFAELSEHLKEWRRLAEPLVKVYNSAGTEDTNIHRQGLEIFNAVREKAIALHNEHGRTGDALRLILAVRGELADVSAELLRVIDGDVKALRSLEGSRRRRESVRLGRRSYTMKLN